MRKPYPMTSDQIQFCKRTCDTATELGIGVRRYSDGGGLATGFEWQLPSGELLRGQAFLCTHEKRALHDACKRLAEEFLNL